MAPVYANLCAGDFMRINHVHSLWKVPLAYILYTLSSRSLVATFFTELDDTDHPFALVAVCVIYREQGLMELSPRAAPNTPNQPK
jgi:hypothetical protein